jgi:hypothetical protein
MNMIASQKNREYKVLSRPQNAVSQETTILPITVLNENAYSKSFRRQIQRLGQTYYFARIDPLERFLLSHFSLGGDELCN